MTYKAIRYSAHAVKQMRLRRITRQMVRTTLALGEPFEPEQFQTVHSRTYPFGRRDLGVIYRESGEAIYIITAEWLGE